MEILIREFLKPIPWLFVDAINLTDKERVITMKDKIKKTLEGGYCGYYDECGKYIVEVNEEKLKELLKNAFDAKEVIITNSETNRLKARNRELEQKMDYMIEVHRKECIDMKHDIDKMAHDMEMNCHKIMEEQEKRYYEMKENGRTLIKAIAQYI